MSNHLESIAIKIETPITVYLEMEHESNFDIVSVLRSDIKILRDRIGKDIKRYISAVNEYILLSKKKLEYSNIFGFDFKKHSNLLFKKLRIIEDYLAKVNHIIYNDNNKDLKKLHITLDKLFQAKIKYQKELNLEDNDKSLLDRYKLEMKELQIKFDELFEHAKENHLLYELYNEYKEILDQINNISVLQNRILKSHKILKLENIKLHIQKGREKQKELKSELSASEHNALNRFFNKCEEFVKNEVNDTESMRNNKKTIIDDDLEDLLSRTDEVILNELKLNIHEVKLKHDSIEKGNSKILELQNFLITGTIHSNVPNINTKTTQLTSKPLHEPSTPVLNNKNSRMVNTKLQSKS